MRRRIRNRAERSVRHKEALLASAKRHFLVTQQLNPTLNPAMTAMSASTGGGFQGGFQGDGGFMQQQ